MNAMRGAMHLDAGGAAAYDAGKTGDAELPSWATLPAAPPPARPWRLISFILIVLLPVLLGAVYLYGFASDQYVSEFRFRLRHAQTLRMDPSSALAGLTGAAAPLQAMTDSEIVVQYLQSRQVLDDLATLVPIDALFARPDADWWARMDAADPIETKLRYWQYMVDPFFDMATGIVTVRVRAFDRAQAQALSAALLGLSEKLVNTLSERAVADKVAYAKGETAAKARAMAAAEVALRQFRNANGVLFPQMQANEATGLDGQLRADLAAARATATGLRARGVAPDGPQMRTLNSRIAGLEAELSHQQTRVTRPDAATSDAAPLASVLASYEALDVDAKIATKSYEMAVMAEQRARDEAAQQQIYLDAFVRPAVPQKSLYPIRWRLLLQIGAGAFILWCLSLLTWKAVLDHVE